MFTGIVEELGSVLDIDGSRFRFGATQVLEGAGLGDSTAVNGCCLTIVDFDAAAGWWDADLSPETLDRTTLSELAVGDPVNLERPVRLMDRLGGHLVQGHVDGIGTVREPTPDLVVEVPQGFTRYMVEKGSITVDGVSLTIVELGSDFFSVAVIPHTEEVTTLGGRQVGSTVNIELDVMAKYAEKLLSGHPTNTAGLDPVPEAPQEAER